MRTVLFFVIEGTQANQEVSDSPKRWGYQTVIMLLVLGFPLSRAEHRRGGRIKARGLSESAVAQAKAGEFPRAPATPTTRRIKRGTGV